MLRDDQSRCVGRSDLSPDSITCPKRDTCARYTDLRDRGSDFSWPKHISVYTHVCDDAALSAFVAVDCGVHERNSAPAPDIALSLGLGLRFHPVVKKCDGFPSSAFEGVQ